MKKRKKIVVKLMSMATIIMIVATVILTIVGSKLVSDAYGKMNKELLKNACTFFLDDINTTYQGEWTEKEDGVYKGDTRISEDNTMVDELKEESGLEYSIFYGNMRISTTLTKEGSSERAVNTPALERIVDIVIKGNSEYFGTNVTLEGVSYNIYYKPLVDSSGKAIGMIFAGRKYADINKDIRHAIMIMAGIAALLIIITITIAVLEDRQLEPIMKEIVVSLENMASGSLNIDIHEDALRRNDELGEIAECIEKLDEELAAVIKKTLQLADNVSSDGESLSSSSDSATGASNQVTNAMEDISKGAISQAESIETAASDTSDIGIAIEGINDKVEELDKYSDIMKTSCDNAMQALKHLLDQNAKVIDSMKIIEHQILSTNEAVKNISNASNLITSISTQTNLLALNASIEAARAGEAGRGFAVVATEIGTLAEQSQAATVEIKTIVSDLISESEKSVQTVNELSESFKLQNKQLDSTVSDMEEMQSGVVNVTASANDISSRSNNLNNAKNNLVDIISDLSAISEENAAATEQTNASMEEFNATFEVINQSATDLQILAKELHDEIRFFTVHD